MQISGEIKAIFDTQKVSDKFQKREFVLITEGNTPYPQHISMQLTQDKCNMLDGVGVGSSVTVSINIRGREWSGPQGVKYFNTLEVWKIEVHSHVAPTNTAATGNDSNTYGGVIADNDDLPF